METRANYVLIGAFTLAGFVGLLLFFVWFARVELDRQYDYFDIEFETVSGLSNASDVRFSGFPVGQVVDVGLAPDRSGKVRVRVEIVADTPVRTSSVATIESLGVTGVSFVGISSGDPRDPLLSDSSDRTIPLIRSGRSVLQTLSEDAPTIVEEVLSVSRQLGELLGTENQERVATILQNVESASANLEQTLSDFSSVADTIATSSSELVAFTGKLEEISAATESVLNTADTTLESITDFAHRAEGTLDKGDAALDSGRSALDTANRFMNEELPGLVADLQQTTETLRQQLAQVSGDASDMMADFRTAGSRATEFIVNAEETLALAETTLDEISTAVEAVEVAAVDFDLLVTESGTELVSETRAFVAEASRVATSAAQIAETDLPAIMQDIRTATETAARVVETVGADLSAAAGRTDAISAEIGTAVDAVTETFTNANATLGRLNTALETGDSALSAADKAFTSADAVLTEDIGPLSDRLRETLDRLDAAIAEVTEDVPVISAELRSTVEAASATFDEVNRTAASMGPPLRAFSNEGLPQFSHLARQARDLVNNLDKLVQRIERDPARYFLGRDEPVFRR